MSRARHHDLPVHHPDDETLLHYASFGLEAPWDLAIATHLAMCPSCRAAVASFEEAGGAILESAAPLDTAIEPAALIARAEAMGPAPRPHPGRKEAEAAGAKAPVFPRPLRDLAGDLDAIEWSPLGGGVKQKILMWRDGASARLLHIAPGVAVAAHGHRGLEMTAVLSGGYYDGDTPYTRGDIQIVAHETPHRPTAMRDQACICLAVTDAPLRFSDWLPRIVQRFARI